MNADRHRHFFEADLLRLLFLSVVICGNLWLASSCTSKPTDVRSVVPADSLVYLETNDLGKALKAVTDNEAFRNAAKKQPDLSALNGIHIGVAVTGFETKEQPVTDENSVLNFQPRFVAVAETNAWNYQANAFAENKLGEFINEIYGGEVELETSPKYDGKYYVWSAQDGRKAYGLVIGSLIFFGNDESAIEKCIAVRKGEAEPISKNTKLPVGEFLSSGYVSPDGVAQLANIVGIQFALGAGEEEEVRGFVARVLPEILRNSVKEITWTATKTDKGIEDRYTVEPDPESANVFAETLTPGETNVSGLLSFVPPDAVSVTRYDLKNAQVAWRSVLLTAQKKTDAASGNIIGAFSSSLFEAYGVDDPETFLSSINPGILTVRTDADGENVIVISTARDIAKLKTSIAKQIAFSKPAESVEGASVWRSNDGDVAFASIGDKFLVGDAESVVKALKANASGQSFFAAGKADLPNAAGAVSVTVSESADTAAKLVQILSERAENDPPLNESTLIETRFAGGKLQRTETSNFGLIGSIIEQLGKE
ncbi:MAG: hypothetical protein KIT61_01015 [Pyrinomonadaceae bacterium]|nr:hypothetical protein [Pyrinomonadaceae bacterium]